jgi:hypothetical protein
MEEEIAIWESQAYRFSLRHKVQTRLGNETALKELEDLLEQVEQALEILHAEMDPSSHGDAAQTGSG